MDDKQNLAHLLVEPKNKGGTRQSYAIHKDNFLDLVPKNSSANRPYLIIGFDTEYQTMASVETKGIKLDNEVLSYQYSCSIISYDNEGKELEWEGIILPESGDVDDRLDIQTFVEFAISHGLTLFPEVKIPRDIFLVAHFTRADIPGFYDFKIGNKDTRAKLNLQNIRGTFVNVTADLDIFLRDDNTNEDIKVVLKVRDTIHLAPQGAKSLEKLGALLGLEKLKLGKTLQEEKDKKENMKAFIKEDWELFRDYAIRDAVVCTQYIKGIVRLYFEETDKFKLPLTLTSIGVSLLTKFWSDQDPPVDPLDVIGKEKIVESYFNKKLNRYVTNVKKPYQKKLHWNMDFITDCYHGGRNEQFWFGPCHEDKWIDYDLSSAYPSAMSLIGRPDWTKIKHLTENHLKLLLGMKPVELAFANVDFEFPDDVRFPVLPVRTETGILFPRTGNCSTHVSEILLAVELGCKIKLIQGVFIPSERFKEDRNRIFRGFLKTCISKRNSYEKKTVNNLFWKEIANSTYGKTAQGLRERRVYDLKSDETKDLPPSTITNPCYAAFITAFCRGTLSEIMNNFPNDVNVFSVTTDGFLTNATEEQMEAASQGILCNHYRDARRQLTDIRNQDYKITTPGDDTIYEIKHIVRQPLGWRTRGQATLKPSSDDDWTEKPKFDEKVVLAKGGIKLANVYGKLEENDEIINYFFNRTPISKLLPVTLLSGIKEMYREGTDLLNKDIEKRLSMEFDWKRKPHYVGKTNVKYEATVDTDHIFFSTQPWENAEQFYKIRSVWNEYNKKGYHCLKTLEDYEAFSNYAKEKLSLSPEAGRYLKKKNGAMIRLRRDLTRAWKHKKSGTHVLLNQNFHSVGIYKNRKLTSQLFADLLNELCGIDCTKFDVDNDRKFKVFVKHQTPNTEVIRNKLLFIKNYLFPKLVIEDFLAKESDLNIDTVDLNECSLSQKMN